MASESAGHGPTTERRGEDRAQSGVEAGKVSRTSVPASASEAMRQGTGASLGAA